MAGIVRCKRWHKRRMDFIRSLRRKKRNETKNKKRHRKRDEGSNASRSIFESTSEKKNETRTRKDVAKVQKGAKESRSAFRSIARSPRADMQLRNDLKMEEEEEEEKKNEDKMENEMEKDRENKTKVKKDDDVDDDDDEDEDDEDDDDDETKHKTTKKKEEEDKGGDETSGKHDVMVFQIPELAQHILSFLDAIEDVPAARFVCRQWNAHLIIGRADVGARVASSLATTAAAEAAADLRFQPFALKRHRHQWRRFKQQHQLRQQLQIGFRLSEPRCNHSRAWASLYPHHHPQHPHHPHHPPHPPHHLSPHPRPPQDGRFQRPCPAGSPYDTGYFASCHAFRNHLGVVRWARFVAGWHWDERTCEEAARGGHFRMLAWARASGCPWDGPAVCQVALRTARIGIARWTRAHGGAWSESGCCDAAIGGSFESLRWAYAHGCNWNDMDNAFMSGMCRLGLFKWALAAGCPWGRSGRRMAFDSNRIGTIRWACAHGYRVPPLTDPRFNARDPFGRAGHRLDASVDDERTAWSQRLDATHWDQHRRLPRLLRFVWQCVRAGLLHTIKRIYATDDGDRFFESIGYTVAGYAGTVGVLRWLRENGATFNTYRTCYDIATVPDAIGTKRRHLAMLRWACAHGCAWGRKTGVYAENKRVCDLDLVRWAIAHGCPWVDRLFRIAALSGNCDVLAWMIMASSDVVHRLLKENNKSYTVVWSEIALAAAQSGRLDLLARIYNRLPHRAVEILLDPNAQGHAGTLCDRAAANGHVAVLQWARARGHPWSENTCLVAAKEGHLRVLLWLRANGCPWSEADCRAMAKRMHRTILVESSRKSCPWHVSTCRIALRRNYHSLLVSLNASS